MKKDGNNCFFCKDADKIKLFLDFVAERKADGETGLMLETFIALGNQLHFGAIDLEKDIFEKQYLEINYCPVCGRELTAR